MQDPVRVLLEVIDLLAKNVWIRSCSTCFRHTNLIGVKGGWFDKVEMF